MDNYAKGILVFNVIQFLSQLDIIIQLCASELTPSSVITLMKIMYVLMNKTGET